MAKQSNIYTYTFSWSGPFRLSDQAEKQITMEMSRIVLNYVPYLGAASLKCDPESEDKE